MQAEKKTETVAKKLKADPVMKCIKDQSCDLSTENL